MWGLRPKMKQLDEDNGETNKSIRTNLDLSSVIGN